MHPTWRSIILLNKVEFRDDLPSPNTSASIPSRHLVWRVNPAQTQLLQCQVGGVKIGSRLWWTPHWYMIPQYDFPVSIFPDASGHYWTVSDRTVTAAHVERNGVWQPTLLHLQHPGCKRENSYSPPYARCRTGPCIACHCCWSNRRKE